MCSASKLIRQIKETEASIKRQKKNVDKTLESPACYAMPLLGFLVGLTCHRIVPDHRKLLAMWMASLRAL